MEIVYDIRRVREITKTILSEGAYHSVNVTDQIARVSKRGKITKDEEMLLQYCWDLRQKMVADLKKELKIYMKKYKVGDKKLETIEEIKDKQLDKAMNEFKKVIKGSEKKNVKRNKL